MANPNDLASGTLRFSHKVHSRSLDPLVPLEMQGRLAKAARSKVTTFRVADARHNDIFQQGGESLYQRVKVFVDGLPAVSTTTRLK